jgi:phosphatidylserine/phosphatidylglycerophosphate/cardiolipin synthase-like enzyme
VVDRAYGSQKRLRAAGVTVLVDSRHAIFHNKYTIVDGTDVETGSYNYTGSAERRNAENCLVIRGDPALGKSYADDWAKHAKHSAAPIQSP